MVYLNVCWNVRHMALFPTTGSRVCRKCDGWQGRVIAHSKQIAVAVARRAANLTVRRLNIPPNRGHVLASSSFPRSFPTAATTCRPTRVQHAFQVHL